MRLPVEMLRRLGATPLAEDTFRLMGIARGVLLWAFIPLSIA